MRVEDFRVRVRRMRMRERDRFGIAAKSNTQSHRPRRGRRGQRRDVGMQSFQITIIRRGFTAPSMWDEVDGGVGLRFRDRPSSRSTP